MKFGEVDNIANDIKPIVKVESRSVNSSSLKAKKIGNVRSIPFSLTGYFKITDQDLFLKDNLTKSRFDEIKKALMSEGDNDAVWLNTLKAIESKFPKSDNTVTRIDNVFNYIRQNIRNGSLSKVALEGDYKDVVESEAQDTGDWNNFIRVSRFQKEKTL